MDHVTRQGAQGILDEASNAQLDTEFGTHKIEDVMEQIMNKGEVQETKVGRIIGTSSQGSFANMAGLQGSGRQGQTNISNGPAVSNMSSMGNVHN